MISTCIKEYRIIAHNDGSIKNIHNHVKQSTIPSKSSITLNISPGSGSKSMSMEAFSKISEGFCCRQVTEDKVDVYPPNYVLPNDVPKELIKISDHFHDYMKSCLGEPKNENSFVSILRCYSSNYHRTLLSQIEQQQNNKKVPIFDLNCMLISNSDQNLLVMLRVCKKDTLREALTMSNEDLISLITVYDKELTNSQIVTSSLVICTDITRKELEDEEFLFVDKKYKELIGTKDNINDLSQFQIYWEKTFLKHVTQNQREIKAAEQTKSAADVLQTITNHSKCILSTTTIPLPSLSDDIEIQLSTILLHQNQIEAIYDKSPFKIVQGSFGSGKSIISQKIIENICNRKTNNEIVYFVLCDPYSLFLVEMKNHLEKNNLQNHVHCFNLYELCKDFAITKYNDIHGLITLITKEKSEKTFHFIFDEVDMQWIDSNMTSKLSTLSNCRICFFAQNLTREQTVLNENDVSIFSTKDTVPNKSFKVIFLTKTFRSTTSINRLARSAERTVSMTGTTIFHPDVLQSNPASKPAGMPSVKTETVAKDPIPSVSSSSSCSTDIPPDDAVNANKAGRSETKIKLENPKLSIPKPLESFGEEMEKKKQSSWKQKTETKFVFNESEDGNNIHGDKPKLFQIKQGERDVVAKSFGLLIQKQVKELSQKQEQLVILCENETHRHLMNYCLQNGPDFTPHFSQSLPPSFQTLKKVSDSFKISRLLLSDNVSFRGMEMKNVITILECGDKYNRQKISELVSRSTVNLVIFLLPENFSKITENPSMLINFFQRIWKSVSGDETGSTVHVITEWVNKKLVEVHNISPQKILKDNLHYNLLGNSFEAYLLEQSRTNIQTEQKPDITREFEDALVGEGSTLQAESKWDGKIFYEIKFHGKKYTFNDVYNLIESNREVFAKMLLDYPWIVNSLRDDDRDETLLMHSARFGHIEEFRYIISSYQQDFSTVSNYGYNVFHYCAYVGSNDDDRSYEITNILINTIMDPHLLNKRDNAGWTPLHHVCWKNFHRTISLLMEHGSDVNIRNIRPHSNDTGLPEDFPGCCDEKTKRIVREFRKRCPSGVKSVR